LTYVHGIEPEFSVLTFPLWEGAGSGASEIRSASKLAKKPWTLTATITTDTTLMSALICATQFAA
jgi:hypothetical protein